MLVVAIVRVGAAQVDITPKVETNLASAVGKFRPAKVVNDPLYAKALVVEADGKKICIVVLDLTIVTEEYSSKIQRWTEHGFRFDQNTVMVHVGQTHSTPNFGHKEMQTQRA